MTYLDSIFDNLSDIGVDQDVSRRLANYILVEAFDTEAMDIDFHIEPFGNIETEIGDEKCIKCIEAMFNKTTS